MITFSIIILTAVVIVRRFLISVFEATIIAERGLLR